MLRLGRGVLLQVFWAHILCLDPVSKQPLPVAAGDLVSPLGGDTHSLSPPDPLMRADGVYSQQPISGTALDVPAPHVGPHEHSSGAGSDPDRTALPLQFYSGLVHVQMHDGPWPPGSVAAGAHAEPDARPAGSMSRNPAYSGLPGPASTQKILYDERSQEALQAALRDQWTQLQMFNSGAPAAMSDASPPDPPDDSELGGAHALAARHTPAAGEAADAHAAQAAVHMPPAQDARVATAARAGEHAPVAHAAQGGPGGGPGEGAAAAGQTGDGTQNSWRSRVEHCCRLAAAQASGATGPADLNAGVILQLRIAMELCDLGACCVMPVQVCSCCVLCGCEQSQHVVMRTARNTCAWCTAPTSLHSLCWQVLCCASKQQAQRSSAALRVAWEAGWRCMAAACGVARSVRDVLAAICLAESPQLQLRCAHRSYEQPFF